MRRALALVATVLLGCSGTLETTAIDAAMVSAYRPHVAVTSLRPVGPYEVLAGDLHCHVRPPDHPTHVVRDFEQTARLAEEENLDFVLLTPHVNARFFSDPGERAWTLATHRALRREIAARSTHTLFIAGAEYTDHDFGHVSLGFADLEQVLADIPLEVAREDPARFFEQWVARGGYLGINHPLVTPISSIVPLARADLSWRPFTRPGPLPPEIATIDALAQGFEAYNLTATHLRDRWLVGDSEHTLRATLALLDREIPRRNRRMTPVGGSDSHAFHLRPTTYVLAESRDASGIRDALVSGRTCVRSPEACSFRVRRAEESAWHFVGARVPHAGAVVARASGGDVEIFRDGVPVITVPSDRDARVPIVAPGCSVLRARVGRGWSAPIYVNCNDLGQSSGG